MRLIAAGIVVLTAGSLIFMAGYLDSDFDLPYDRLEVVEKINDPALNAGISLNLFGVIIIIWDIFPRGLDSVNNSGIGINAPSVNHHNPGKYKKNQR
jgi:hypothetical protein